MMRPILVLLAACGAVFAQSEATIAVFAQSEAMIESRPPKNFIDKALVPFHLEKRVVPPVKLTNTPRLESLVRGGNLYLSVEDVIALVLENNLDIAVQRYSPLLAREMLRRAESGGFLRQADTPVVAGPSSVSTTGINIGGNGLAGGSGLGGGGGIVSQIGPIPPSLDPNLFASFNIGHLTTPQTNTVLTQTTSLTQDYRQYVLQYSQQWATGTSASATFFTGR